MPTLKEIRKRIASVKNTQKITKAMKLVSAAKLRRAQDAIDRLRPYAAKHRAVLAQLLSELQVDPERPVHPLMTAHSEVKSVALVVLSSDRGMCGGFNSNLLRFLKDEVKRHEALGRSVTVYPVGRRAVQFCQKMGLKVGQGFGEIAKAAETERVREIADCVVGGFVRGELDEVQILLNRLKSALSQFPELRTLLPFGDAREVGEEMDVLFEPSRDSLLAYLVPRAIEVTLKETILESLAGEHAARMNAMSSATDNAADMISALTLQLNRARQAAITKELVEIISGAEALN